MVVWGVWLLLMFVCGVSGAPVLSGSKFIARSDLVFRRCGTPRAARPPSEAAVWQSDPKFVRSRSLYRLAARLETQGKLKQSGELYDRGLAVRQFQCKSDLF
jgi:hypothetical protein